jgi:hypothetical protein
MSRHRRHVLAGIGQVRSWECAAWIQPVVAAGSLVALLLASGARAGEVSATQGPLDLGTRVNGMAGGRCQAGQCEVSGGTAAGANLFHRFNRFDTRGEISGVSIQNGLHRTVVLGVLDPLGSFLNKGISLSSPAHLFFLSPGGLHVGAGAQFFNTPQLTLSTASSLGLGSGRFDVFRTTASEAALLTGMPIRGVGGLASDPAEAQRNGITNAGDLVVDGGLIQVDAALLLDAQGGHLLLQAGSQLAVPGGSVELNGKSVSVAAGALVTTSALAASAPASGPIAAPAEATEVQAAVASTPVNHEAPALSAPVLNPAGLDGGVIRISAIIDAAVAGQLSALGGVATASGAAGKGGRIEVTGERVALKGAALDASGPAGGGTVLVGGGLHGANPAVPNATATTVDRASTVRADALAAGDGGTVVAYGSQGVTVAGLLSARGGPAGGNGGFVETSGATLALTQTPDASAPKGKGGTWLIDPHNLSVVDCISSGSSCFNSNVNVAPGDSNNPLSVDTTGDNAEVEVSTITDALNAGTSVILRTSPGGSQQGNIIVDAPIIKTSGADASLTLNAHNDIFLNSDITSSSAALSLYLNPDIDLNGSGAITLANTANLNLNNGAVTINSPNYTSPSNLNSTINASALYLNGGNVNLTGTIIGSTPINLNGSGVYFDDNAILNTTISGAGRITTFNGTLTNAGTIQATGGQLVIDPVTLVNTGTITSDSVIGTGTLNLIPRNFTNSGSVTLANSSSLATDSLTISDGSFLQVRDNSIAAASALNLIGGGISMIDNSFLSTTSLTMSGGSLQVRDASSIQTNALNLSGGSISGGNASIPGGGAIDILGSFSRSGGTIDGDFSYLGITQSSGSLTPGALRAAGPVVFNVSNGQLTLDAPITASTVLAISYSGITLLDSASLITSSSGTAIILDARSGTFLNSAGPGVLKVQPKSTWAIYADNPSSTPSSNLGGLPLELKQYNTGSNPILGNNGLYYAYSPTLSVNLVPATTQVGKVYDATVTANLVAENYSFTGVVAGDQVSINKPTTGAYDNKNVGTGKLISVSGLNVISAEEIASGVSIYGYSLQSPEASGAIGSITPLPLSGAGIAPGSSIYSSSLVPGAVSFGNIVGSDEVVASAIVNTSTLSSSGQPIVGTYSQSASGLTGNDAGNYSFSGFTSTPNYTISKLPLTGCCIGTGSSIYGSVLAPGAVSFSNIVGSDAVGSSASVNTSTVSTSGNPIVGTYSQSASTSLTGTDAGNYSFSGFTSTPNYTISKLALTGAGIGSGSSIYGSALTPGAVSFGNIVGNGASTDRVGSSASVNASTLSSTGNPIVGSYSQSASALTGVDAGSYSFSGFTSTPNYTISKLDLTGAAIALGSSIYGSALTPGAVSFGNIVGNGASTDLVGANASVNTSTLSSSGNPIVGSYNQSASSTLSGTDAGNYFFLGFTSTPNYTISKLALSGAGIASGSSTYGSVLAPGAVSFGNIVGSDAVGSSASVNASTLSSSGQPIVGTYSQNASGLTGTDAGNYSFTGFTSAENYSISRAPLNPSFSINDKPFDGNSVATIAGYNLQGVVAGDDIFIAKASATFDNAFAGNNKPVTIDGFSLSGTEVSNYHLSSNIATATASITPSAIVPPNEEPITPRAIDPPNEEPITPRPGIDAFPPRANEEPIKNNHGNPGVGLQSAKISSLSNPQSVEIDSSNISPSASVAAASNATSSGPDPSQPTPRVSAVSADSAAQGFQESEQRSAEGANTSLGLSNAGAGVAMSPARLQQLMQSAADLIRRYPVRMLNP